MSLRSKGIYLTFCFLFYLVIGAPVSQLMAETLTNPRMIFTGSNPSTVSVGDFNGDGKPDLAYLDAGFPFILHILLGNGDGTFQPGQDIPLPAGIGGVITVADINNDGRLDLILGGSGPTRQIGVFLGNGDGTFGSIIVSVLPIDLFLFSDFNFAFGVADLNGDGAMDLIVSDPQNDAIYSLLGNNTGSFTLQASIFNGGAPGTVLTGDFNGDGKPDFLVREVLGNEVTVYVGNGDGTFQTGVSYTNGNNRITSVVLADMDGDGHLDLVVTDFINNISIFRGNADGTFATTSSGGASLRSAGSLVGVADFNGDGVLDLAVVLGGNLAILVGQGNLTYAPAVSFVGAAPGLVFADFNLDGHLDAASPAPGGIVLLLGNGNATFQSFDTYFVDTGVGPIAVADFNGDHISDIAVGGSPSGVRILAGDGHGKFTVSPTKTPGPLGVLSISAGNFNGDTAADLLLTGNAFENNNITGTNVVLFGNGDGTFSAPFDLSLVFPGISVAGIADLNHDGKTDILAAPKLQTLQTLLGQPANAFTTVASNFPFNLNTEGPVAFADFNHDGILDVVFAGFANIQPFLGNGDGTFKLAPPVSVIIPGVTIGNPTTVAAADLDGDGNVDVVITIGFLPEMEIFYGKGDGTFNAPVLLPLSRPVTQLLIADMNADGKPDLVLGDEGTTTNPPIIFVIHNNGGRSFGPEVHYLAGSIGTMAVQDLNGDGFPDVIVGSGDSSVGVLMNEPGRTTSAGTFILTPAPSPLAQPLTATLTMAKPTVTGSVIFSIDNRPIGHALLSSGVATLTGADTSNFGVGAHTVTALYSGDASFTPATFVSPLQIVPVIHPTTVSLSASPNPAVASQTVHFTVTVSSAGPTPTGTVAIHDGASTIGSIRLDPTTGIGVFNSSLLAPGTHSITAIYDGDINSAPGTSNAVSVLITAFSTTTTLSILPAAPQVGSSFALSATVTSSSGSPSGSVSFFDGTALLGSRELDSSDTAVLITTFASPGTHSFTATYNANAQFAASTSAAKNLNPAGGTIILSSLQLSIAQDAGTRWLLTGTVQPAPEMAGERLVFFSGNAALGEANVTASGTATLEIAGVFPGTHYFTAVLNGNNQVAASAATTLVGSSLSGAPEFAMRLSAASANVAANQPAMVDLTIDPINGFSGQLALSCSSMANVTCLFQPASLNTGGKSTVTLILASEQSGGAASGPLGWYLLFGWISALMTFVLASSKQRRMRVAAALLAAVLVGIVLGCGGNESKPKASLTVTITASSQSGASHSLEFEVLLNSRNTAP